MHLSSIKALFLGTRNSDRCEVLAPKLKGIKAQERVDRSSRLQDSNEFVGYVLIKSKLPLYSVDRIMNIVDALIS